MGLMAGYDGRPPFANPGASTIWLPHFFGGNDHCLQVQGSSTADITAYDWSVVITCKLQKSRYGRASIY